LHATGTPVPLEARGHHVVDQPVLIGQARGVELLLELLIEISWNRFLKRPS